MMFWFNLVIIFVGPMLVGISALMTFGLLGIGESMGSYKPDGTSEHTGSKQGRVVRNILIVFALGVALTALGFGLMAVTES